MNIKFYKYMNIFIYSYIYLYFFLGKINNYLKNIYIYLNKIDK